MVYSAPPSQWLEHIVKPKIFVDSTQSLEEALHTLIPISSAMGIKVIAYSGNALTLSAPLTENINHQQSAFGGSLFSVAVLAGWGLMQLKLSELDLDCNTVIMGAEVAYRKPVFEDLTCRCELPPDAEQLFALLARDGKMKTEMSSVFSINDKVAMRVLGRYHVQSRNI